MIVRQKLPKRVRLARILKLEKAGEGLGKLSADTGEHERESTGRKIGNRLPVTILRRTSEAYEQLFRCQGWCVFGYNKKQGGVLRILDVLEQIFPAVNLLGESIANGTGAPSYLERSYEQVLEGGRSAFR